MHRVGRMARRVYTSSTRLYGRTVWLASEIHHVAHVDIVVVEIVLAWVSKSRNNALQMLPRTAIAEPMVKQQKQIFQASAVAVQKARELQTLRKANGGGPFKSRTRHGGPRV